jgi:putative flippase GtrA
MSQFMQYLNPVIYILVALIKLAGMLVIGLGIGWLALDVFRKGQPSVQIAFFLGIIALLIALLLYSHLGLGAFGIGMGAAILRWGMPRLKK